MIFPTTFIFTPNKTDINIEQRASNSVRFVPDEGVEGGGGRGGGGGGGGRGRRQG